MSSIFIPAWFLRRIDQFAKANNYPTVYALLENGLRCSGVRKKVLSKLIGFIREQTYWQPLGELTLLLCDWIVHNPNHYNREVRAYFRKFLQAHRASTYNDTGNEVPKVLREMLRAIGAVGDITLLPDLEGEMSEEDVAKLFQFVTIHKELLVFHGARLLLVQYLKQIRTRKSTGRKTRAA